MEMKLTRCLTLLVVALFVRNICGEVFFGKLSLKTPTTGKRHSVFESNPYVFATRRSTYLKKSGDVFKIHLPGIAKGVPNENTVSFESVRFPDYFLSHDISGNKNIFKIAKKTIPENPDDSSFETASTFYVERRAGIEGSGLLRLFNSPDKYLCIGKNNFADSALQAMVNDHSNEVDFKHRCSFFIQKLKDDRVEESVQKSKMESTGSSTSVESPPQQTKSNVLNSNNQNSHTLAVNRMLFDFNKKIENHQKILQNSKAALKKQEKQKTVQLVQPVQAKSNASPVKIKSGPAKAITKPLPAKGNVNLVKTKPVPTKTNVNTVNANLVPVKGNGNPVKANNPLPAKANTGKSNPVPAKVNAKPDELKTVKTKSNTSPGKKYQQFALNNNNNYQSTFGSANYLQQQNPLLSMYNTAGYNNIYSSMYGNMFNPNTYTGPFYNSPVSSASTYQSLLPVKTNKPASNKQLIAKETKEPNTQLLYTKPAAVIMNKNLTPQKMMTGGGKKKNYKVVGPKRPINLHNFTNTHNQREPSLNLDGLMTGVKVPVARSEITVKLTADKVNGTKINSTRSSVKPADSTADDQNIFYTVKNLTSSANEIIEDNFNSTTSNSSSHVEPYIQNSYNDTKLQQKNNNTKDFNETIITETDVTATDNKTVSDERNSLTNSSIVDDGNNTFVLNTTNVKADNQTVNQTVDDTKDQVGNETIKDGLNNQTDSNLNNTETVTNSNKTLPNTSRQRNEISGSRKNSLLKFNGNNESIPSTTTNSTLNHTKNIKSSDKTNLNNNNTVSNTSLVDPLEEVRLNSSRGMDNNNNVSVNLTSNSTHLESDTHMNAVKKEKFNSTKMTSKKLKNSSLNKNSTANGTVIKDVNSKHPIDGNLVKPTNGNDTSGHKKNGSSSFNATVAKNPTDSGNLNKSFDASSDDAGDSPDAPEDYRMLSQQNVQRDSKDDTASLLNSAFPHSKHKESDIYLNPQDNGPLHELSVNTSSDLRSPGNSTLNSSLATMEGGEPSPDVQNDENNYIYNNNKRIGKANDFDRVEMSGIDNAMHNIDDNEISRISKQMNAISRNGDRPMSISDELKSGGAIMGVGEPQLNYNNTAMVDGDEQPVSGITGRNVTVPGDTPINATTQEPEMITRNTTGDYNNAGDVGSLENQTSAEPLVSPQQQLSGVTNQTTTEDSTAENMGNLQHLAENLDFNQQKQKADSSQWIKGIANRTTEDSLGLSNPDIRSHLRKHKQRDSPLLNRLMNDIVLKGISRDHVLSGDDQNHNTHVDDGNLHSIDDGNLHNVDNGYHGQFHQGADFHVGTDHHPHDYLETDPMSPPDDNAHTHYDGVNHHYNGIHALDHHYGGGHGIEDDRHLYGIADHRYNEDNSNYVIGNHYGNNAHDGDNDVDHLNSHALNELHGPLHEHHNYDDHGVLNQESWNEINGDGGFTHRAPFQTTPYHDAAAHPVVGSPNYHSTTLYETDHYIPAKSNGLYLTDDEGRIPHMSDEMDVVHHTHHVVTVKNEAEKQKMVHGLVNIETDKCVSLQIVNDISRRYRLVSSINKHGYTPRGKLFTLKTVFKDPSAHRVVLFQAINELDPSDVLLINGKKKLIAVPTSCNEPGKIVHVTHVNQRPSVVGCGSSGGDCVSKKDVIARHIPADFYSNYEKFKQIQQLHQNYMQKRSDIPSSPSSSSSLSPQQRQGCTRTYGGSNRGSSSCCVFPFNFNGVSHSNCIPNSAGKSWCGLTGNVDQDKRWGLCMIPTIPDTKEQQLSCPSYCSQQCLPSCPSNCCYHGKRQK